MRRTSRVPQRIGRGGADLWMAWRACGQFTGALYAEPAASSQSRSPLRRRWGLCEVTGTLRRRVTRALATAYGAPTEDGGGNDRTARGGADPRVGRRARRGLAGHRRPRARRVAPGQRPRPRRRPARRRRAVVRHEPGRAIADDPPQRLDRLRRGRTGGAVLRRPVLLPRPAGGARRR